MVLGQKRRAVGRFSNRLAAENAVCQLKRAGFSTAQISIVAKYTDRDAQLDGAGMSDCAETETQSKTAAGAITGGMLGAVVGCLVGLGMLTVPGIGAVLAVGTSGTAIATTLGGGGVGVVSGGLISALAGLKIFPEHSRVESDRDLPGEYLVMVDAMNYEVHRAESILSRANSSKVWVC
jgi:hypothetical protein